MDFALSISSPLSIRIFPIRNLHSCNNSIVIFNHFINHANDAVSRPLSSKLVVSYAKRDSHMKRSSLESLFCYDKAIPEERIEKPVGITLAEKNIRENPICSDCQAKGAVLCATCSGSGLYVDSIMESQGIIVKVRCLGTHFLISFWII
ncbi:hypothetical protein Leryth_027368 [Lithospermum erythrorhizon]|nr:hypothetical protein Leryth_027368 [Lithospermum erythrorhizon]